MNLWVKRKECLLKKVIYLTMDILIFLVVGFIVGMHQTTWERILTKKWRGCFAFLKRNSYKNTYPSSCHH